VRRPIIIIALLASAITGASPVALASSTPKPGAVCTIVNQLANSNGYTYQCLKSGKKISWAKVAKVSAPNPTASQTTSTLPAIAEGDDQYFYDTQGCKNKIMFVRYNRSGVVIRNNVIINSIGNYQLVPKFYIEGTLLFESFDCDTKSETLYTVNLANPNIHTVVDTNIQPQIVYGPTTNTIEDATIDVASKTPIILVNANGISQVVMGGFANTVLWSSNSTSGFSPQSLLTQTGYQFLVFGNFGCCGTKRGFGGYQIDYKQGFVNLFAYTPNLYLNNGNAVIAGEGWNDPLVFATGAGIYLCGNPGQYPLNIQTDTRCGLVTSKSLPGMSMAISFGGIGSYDLIAGDSIYNFPFPTSFYSYNEKPIIAATFPNLRNLIFNNDYVSTFEITSDLGKISKSWNYYGTYFSHN